jgi:hypothetical protein
MRYHFRVIRAMPDLGLEPGDLVTYDPADAAKPYIVHRVIQPDPGALLLALNNGTIEGSLPPTLSSADAPPPRRLGRPVLRLHPRDSRSAG